MAPSASFVCMGIPGLLQSRCGRSGHILCHRWPKTVLKLATGFISICGVVVCLSWGQTQGSGEICSQFQHFSSVCVLLFPLWSPGGAAEGQMLNVRTNVSKRPCLHSIEGKSGFPCSVDVPEAGGSKCVCVFVFSSMTCSSTQQCCVHAEQDVGPADVLWEMCLYCPHGCSYTVEMYQRFTQTDLFFYYFFPQPQQESAPFPSKLGNRIVPALIWALIFYI